MGFCSHWFRVVTLPFLMGRVITYVRHPVLQGPANVDAIGVLAELGANTAAVTDVTSQETPLHIAARSGRVDVVNKLLACKVTLLSRTKVSPDVPGLCQCHKLVLTLQLLAPVPNHLHLSFP